MRYRFYFLFTFFTFLFLFYPGDSYYFHFFAYNRALFAKEEKPAILKIGPVPFLKSQYYPSITAQGVYVVDLPSFTPVFYLNPKAKFLPASTTKIITALVANSVFKPYDVLTVKTGNVDGQVMGLVPGEKITAENLMYGMLVYSGNDAALAFADNYGYDKFIKLMNEKAQELKMTGSHFVNPVGYDSSGQYSTPFDLALGARELLKNSYLSNIVSIKEITVSDTNFKYFHHLTNVNQLLGEIQGVGGLKSGYTQDAGENLVTFYKYAGHQFILVVLKSTDRFADTRNIINWIDSNVDYFNPQ